MTRLLTTVTAALLMTTAVAQAGNQTAFPDFDSAAYCRALGVQADKLSPGVSRSNASFNYCMEQEQEGYNKAKLLWGQLSPEAVAICAANSYRSYINLGNCAEIYANLNYMQEKQRALEAAPSTTINKW